MLLVFDSADRDAASELSDDICYDIGEADGQDHLPKNWYMASYISGEQSPFTDYGIELRRFVCL